MKIGFFDSGLGGLTILKKVRQQLPQYDYFYYGDTEHMPYGDKTEEEIYVLTKNAIISLLEKDIELVIVACNTASAEALRKLQDEILVGEYAGRRLLGVIIPTIEVLVESGARNALLIGTKRTVDSHKYDIELSKIPSDLSLKSRATPELVPLIEAGNIQDACLEFKKIIEQESGEIDTIILGCTHYTVLKDYIREHYEFQVISQDEIIPRKLEAYLTNHPEIESKLSRNKSIEIMLSKSNDYYDKITAELLLV